MLLIKLALFAVVMAVCPAVLATEAQAWYQVAVVVFAQPLDTDEDLDDQPAFPWPTDLREPSPVPETQSSLYATYTQLRRAQSLRPLLHLAWIQPASPGRNAPYHVSNGETVAGVVSLERGEALHAIVDMEYRAADGKLYRLREKRQLKLNEIHYLDHPVFGVLIQVIPVLPP